MSDTKKGLSSVRSVYFFQPYQLYFCQVWNTRTHQLILIRLHKAEIKKSIETFQTAEAIGRQAFFNIYIYINTTSSKFWKKVQLYWMRTVLSTQISEVGEKKDNLDSSRRCLMSPALAQASAETGKPQYYITECSHFNLEHKIASSSDLFRTFLPPVALQ